MKTKTLIVVGIVLLIFLGINIAGGYVSRETYVAPEPKPELVTHAQKVWIAALEWCESRGRPEAVNPKDKDNTPSYYSFQFKPGTFRYYGEKYWVIEPGLSQKTIMERMKDQDVQQLIVEHMVNDKAIKWEHEFPDCVKRKIGRPPVY